MSNPVLQLTGEEVDVTVERVMDYENDDIIEITIFDNETGDSTGVVLGYQDVEALVGFIRGNR